MSIERICLLPAIMLCAAAFSCTRDQATIDIPGPEPTAETRVTLSLRMPAGNGTQPATVDENMVRSAYILSFKTGDGIADGDEVYDYNALAYSITDGDESRYKTIQVTLLKKDYPQKLVLVTNAKKAVEDLDLQPGVKTKKEVLEMLEFTTADTWHSHMDGFIPIPMWGEAEKITIDDNTHSIGSLVLTRMVSRIDVVKDGTVGDDLFTVTSVHLYNRLTEGRIAPNRAATHWDSDNHRAIHPTLPASGNNKIKGPVAAEAVTLGGETIVPTLYAFEAEAPSDGAPAAATCVVIGGVYNGAPKPSYYRVDFVDKDDAGLVTGYRHLLRNHMYRINITDVYGSGHETPDEAFDSQAVNIEAEVKEWDEGTITDVVFDKDHMLGVSQREFNLPRNASADNLLIATTDVPAGWWIDDTATAPWLTFRTDGFSAVDAQDEIWLELTANDTGSPRTTTFSVRAGRMSIVITVKQGVNELYRLEVTESGQAVDNLLFTSYGDQLTFDQRTVSVDWLPATEGCMVSYHVTGDYGPAFTTDPFMETLIQGGTRPYTIYPNEITAAEKATDPFMKKSARVNYVVGEGPDALVRTLSIRQVHYDLIAAPADSYPLDGGTYAFPLSTNADWEITAIGGNTSLAKPAATSGGPATSGTDFYFTMASDPDGKVQDRTMTITFTYTGEDGRSATETVTITGEPARKLKDAGEANSYILEPGGDGVAIPLSWANGSPQGTLIGDNDKVTLKVLWMDTDRGIADNSVISDYLLKGNGASGTIEVYPGTQQGNALIAAIVNGEIKWSWHIWVTDYDIDGTTFSTASQTWMNINLGAVTDMPGSLDSYGMLYQFGRKDPFPRRSSATSSGNSQRALWDENGNPVHIDFIAPPVANNILHAISTPTTFYKGVGGNDNDWTSSGAAAKNNTLWYDGSAKTHYDPCPAGWRTANPASGSGSGFTEIGNAGSGDPSLGGWTFTGTGSWWQFSGWITHSGAYQMGRYGNSAMDGFFWGATTNNSGQYAYAFHLTSTWPSSAAEIERASAMSVRCVRDK